jgi:Uma2 family endonuclease
MRDMTTIAGSLLTAEELEGLSVPGKDFELVRGRLIVREPPGGWHGRVALRLGIRVGSFVEQHALGEVFGQDTGFKIRSNPDTVLAPDFAFIAADRAPSVPRSGYPELVPDLVAEILSPRDRPGEVLAKVADWLNVGAKIVWVIDPDRFVAHVHRADGSLSQIDRQGALDGEEVVPGFSCALREILE